MTRTSFFFVVSTFAWKVPVFVPLLGRVVLDGEAPALAVVAPVVVVLFAALVFTPLVLVSGFDAVVFCGDASIILTFYYNSQFHPSNIMASAF